jgi:hypothetical protein
MQMAQTYRGYLENGRFIPLEAVIIPDRVEVRVTLLEDSPRVVNTANHESTDDAEMRLEWWNNFFSSMNRQGGDEITDADIAWLNANRVNFKRELDL